jgi:hypothetical protein
MFRRCTVAILLVALVLPVAAQRPGGMIIRCESGIFGRFKRCAAPTTGRVELIRERSYNRCRQGQTWGWDRGSIWVDDGCKAEFRVGGDWGRGRGPGGGPGPGGYYDDRYRDRGTGTGTAIAVGAITAAAIIAAILASKDKQPAAVEEGVIVPDWAVGAFRGYSPKTDRYIDVTIARAGQVTGALEQDGFVGQVTKDGRLQLGEVAFDLKRQSWGFVATQVDDPENIVSFRRQ